MRPKVDAERRESGAGNDYYWAVDCINRISADRETIDLYFALAKRRCTLLVEHYAPEIEALAVVLLERRELSGDEARKLWWDSTLKRHARRMRW